MCRLSKMACIEEERKGSSLECKLKERKINVIKPNILELKLRINVR